MPPYAIAVLLCLITIVSTFLVCYARRIRGINREFAELARRIGGELTVAGFAQHPQLRFPFKGARASIGTEPAPRNQGNTITVMRLPWMDRDLRLEVYPSRFYTDLKRLFGKPAIKTGVARFDRDYYVQGNDPERIRQILNAGVQMQIELLRHMTVEHDVHMIIAGGEIQLRKRRSLTSLSVLARFAALGMELHEQATIGNMVGIQIVSERNAIDSLDASCRVCGDPIGRDVVYCGTCKTPHHYDCWTYNGACSIYGCGGKSYLSGRRAARALGGATAGSAPSN